MVLKLINIDSAALEEAKNISHIDSDPEVVHRALTTLARVLRQPEGLDLMLKRQRELREQEDERVAAGAEAESPVRDTVPRP